MVQPREMAQRRVRLTDETQRQPAGQPFRLGEVVALGLTVAAGQAVSEVEIPAAQGAADPQLALEPPERRSAQRLGRVEEQLDHALVEPVLAAPAQAIENEARIAAQACRHRLDRLVQPGLPPLQADPRLGEAPVAGRHQLEHPVRRAPAVVPQQVVEAGDMVRAGQVAPVLLEKAPFLALREITLDPGAADQRLRPLILVDLKQRLGIADVAARGQRRPVGEQPSNQRVVGRIGDRALGQHLQLLGPRPVRIVDEEAGDRREVRRLAVLDHPQPAQGLGRQRVVDQSDQTGGARPFAPLGRPEGLVQHHPVLGIESLRRRDRGDPNQR